MLIYASQFDHDTIDSPTSIYPIESGKCGKKENNLQKFEYLKLFRWSKKIFIVFEELSFDEKITIVDRSFK